MIAAIITGYISKVEQKTSACVNVVYVCFSKCPHETCYEHCYIYIY